LASALISVRDALAGLAGAPPLRLRATMRTWLVTTRHKSAKLNICALRVAGKRGRPRPLQEGMHVPTARRMGLQVPELLELDRTEPMPAAMLVLMRELADADTDVTLAGEEEGSVAFWACRASNNLLHGMDGPYLKPIKAVFPSRKVQGRLYLLGSMIMATYVRDLDADDVETIIELWNEAPTEQLEFAAELSMRLEMSRATREAQGGVAWCMEKVRTHWR